MHIYRHFILLIVTLFTITNVSAQPTEPENAPPLIKTQPKREFRGVWIATVVNIDWPSSTKLTTDKQKQELLNILNSHQETGINAVMLQVRPAADAFYAKSREPWSKYLTGKQGLGPNPAYDPLEFAITEAHKRGMELHAWFNPYRATFDGNFAALSPQHITKIKPEWFFSYGGIKTFNPGLPEVRDYIVQVILDVVDNYDIDGVHMDDYFYPYPIAGQKINDEDTYAKYGEGYDNIKDWRRHNVDLLIQMIGDSVHAHDPNIKFGVSPFGIWANKAQNVEGSETSGGSSYYENYADSRKWMKEGWVDYINPQLYWPIGNRAAAFDKLLDWWSNNTYGRHLYIGQAAYRINERKTLAFKSPSQLPNQINLIRNNPRVQGSVYFSSNSVTNNPLGFTDSLRDNYYRYPALPPVMLWRDSIAPNPPREVTAKPAPLRTGVILKWLAPALAKDEEPVYGYVIYRFEDEKINIDDPKNILKIQYNTDLTFDDNTVQKGKTYFYVITALDRLKNESDRSPTIAVTVP
ncbi:Uncharacterized lipoprotein YddW, UPF0748 family [Mucilaginibacter pineti]|uniref:Uncharacterized lipoprotein YddW, UPF0748 family n=1 Tax=Mucilaginibacter pineti TaxID=1391627 RepID=A0A1G7FS25_9SPHI|nr:family 10 glycosylhydrolase [Mucilaginibacter pineti]SDE78515.1 Uncharacterized lipoprotein YddW, UPF0748 family [Mucilaginibacter pineti]